MTPDPIQVSLVRADSYDKKHIKEFLDSNSVHFSVDKQFNGKKVLLKPNLISGRAPALACTNGQFIAAVAEWFLDCGAQVSIGDSPAFGSLHSVLSRHGIANDIAHLDITILPFKTVRKTILSHGVAIGIADEPLDCDYFVNLPKIKAHNQMYLTAAVKNLFGIVCGMRKAVAHMKNGSSHIRFGDLMLNLVKLLPDNISIADGIIAMHREGPINGEPLHLGCLTMSNDPVALDTAILNLLELEPGFCPVWRAAKRRKLVGSYLENISFPFAVPSDFSGSGFVAPETLSPVPFNPLRFFTSLVKRITLRVSS